VDTEVRPLLKLLCLLHLIGAYSGRGIFSGVAKAGRSAPGGTFMGAALRAML